MNIALEYSEARIKLFVEGLNWETVNQFFSIETVSVELLVFYKDDKPIFYDSEQSNNELNFCREPILFTQLLKKIGELNFGHPCELRFSNSDFYLRQHFIDAYTIIFTDDIKAQKFLGSIENFVSVREQKVLSEALQTRERSATWGFEQEFIRSKNIDEFISKRFSLWHEQEIATFESSDSYSK